MLTQRSCVAHQKNISRGTSRNVISIYYLSNVSDRESLGRRIFIPSSAEYRASIHSLHSRDRLYIHHCFFLSPTFKWRIHDQRRLLKRTSITGGSSIRRAVSLSRSSSRTKAVAKSQRRRGIGWWALRDKTWCYNVAKRWTTTELLRSACRGSSREPRPGQVRRKRIVRRRIEADVSIVLLVKESAGERIRLVINHPSDAKRIDVAERADVAVGLPFFFVILPPQIILETICRGVSAVVRREIARVVSRNGRLIAWPDGGTSDFRIVRSFENLGRWSSCRSTVVRGLWSMIGIQGLEPRWRVACSTRIIISKNRSRSDGRRSIITGSDIVAGQWHDGIRIWSSVTNG